MKHKQGFTLLEILLVLLVLSLSAMAVVMTLPDNSQETARKNAERLYQRMQLLSEEAIFSGRNYGVYVDEAKHEIDFLMLSNQGWKPLESTDMNKVVSVEDDVGFRFELGGEVWNNSERLFKPGSLFEDMDFGEEEDDKKRVYKPQVILFTSGEMTAFSLHFWSSSTPDQYWTVTSSSDGVLRIKSPEESRNEAK
ncbi:type II secretion system minor pseudopilin GspH [Vibrio quintilis]|uniref:Type II secretion system protein H n=1 Tax=Vibrio quintilis TaxID=1117707 RepID=A0A1M7Z0E2_9VIBR|nr:type II secretion system minor pseudopilin GspH [Vibrio quintilis]SHO58361.1 Type II secretion system protein H precursor [Vibrio quintilis]